MEDFEKIKNEESQNKTKENVVNQDNTNISNSSTNNKKKNNKVLKISLGSVAAVVLVGAGIFVGTKLIGDKTLTIDNNGTQNSSLTAENNVQTIDEQKLEEGIKNTLIKLAQKETSSMKSGNNAYAEGHVLLKSEIKNNKIYAYILTEYGVYTKKDNSPYAESGSSIPLTLVFEILDSNAYTLAEIKEPNDGEEYAKSLKEIFPEDLISSVSKLSDGTYEEEFNKQILEYLKNLSNNQTSTVTEAEIKEIEKFVNNTENQVFALINYNSPEELFTNKYNEHNISEMLRYSLNESKYAIPATTEQNKIIWKENNGEMIISTKVTNISDIIEFLNEKLNYTYSENTIRKYFTIDSELDKYVIMVSDTLFGKFKVKNVTKDGNKYNVKLTPENTITSKDIDIVLTKENDKYYFYSCNLNNVEKLSQKKIAELEKFINKPENNAFVSFNYKNSSDVITENYDANKAQTLSMGLIEGGYAKIASEEEQKIINTDTSIQVPHIISLDEINNFLTEKIAASFEEDEIKKSFKNEYNEKIGKVVLYTVGALEKNAKIKDAYKIGEFNNYYLTLNNGKTVVLMERNDGTIIFESCTVNNE